MSAGIARFDTVPAPARAFHGTPAGLVTRTIANIIDLVVVVVLLVGCYLGVSGFLFLRRGADFRFPTVTYAQAYWVGFALLVVYFAWSWSTTGRTVGDRTMGLRVGRANTNGQLGAARASIRALLCATLPFLLLWVAIDRRRRSVQDLLAGTSVVYDWGGRPARPSGDPAGMAVDVAPPVADEPEDGDPESVARLDGE
jgi:uncharacterized RDD family membrane protein YckC